MDSAEMIGSVPGGSGMVEFWVGSAASLAFGGTKGRNATRVC